MPESKYSLLTGPDTNLKLDPAIQQQMKAIEAMLDSNSIINKLSLMPSSQMWLNMQMRQSPTLNTMSGQNKPLVPQGKGPDKPRSGELSDLLDALMGVPAIKIAFDRTKDQALDHLKKDWKSLSTGGKALLITQSVLIGGGTLAGVMTHNQSRQKALEFIQGKKISIPGVDGLSFQVSPTGKEKKFMLNFDIAEFVRSRNK